MVRTTPLKGPLAEPMLNIGCKFEVSFLPLDPRAVVDILWACSDLVVIRYVSCVGRSSILIVIPLSLVVCMSFNNRPGAT